MLARKRLLSLVSFALCLSSVFPLSSFSATLPEVRNHLDGLFSRTPRNVLAGAKIVRLSDGAVLYERNADQLLTPASTQKVYTDAAALLFLGSKFQFKTQLLTDAAQASGPVLHGNLYVKFDGDPTFTSDDLQSLFNVLKSYHIRHITGNVYLDTSVFKNQPYSPGSSATDKNHAYGAQKTPLIIDQNAIQLSITPGPKPRSPAYVKVLPDNHFLDIESTVRTEQYSRSCNVVYRLIPGNKITASGCIYAGYNSMVKSILIRDPVDYTSRAIVKILHRQGIQFDGQVLQASSGTSSAKQLGIHYSAPLIDIVTTTLKVSNNMFADAVYLKLGQLFYGMPGSWETGGTAVMQILHNHAGANFDGARFIDGSGLSRQNRTTVSQMISVLSFMYANFPIAYEFIAALPKNGIDGTLKKRLRNDYMRGWVRAKTGTMGGIAALSGYTSTKNQQQLVFSMVMNGPGSVRDFRQIQDQVLLYLANTNVGTVDMSREQEQMSSVRGSKPHSAPVPRDPSDDYDSDTRDIEGDEAYDQ